MAVIPERSDEFPRRACLLIRHRFQLVRTSADTSYCRECQG